MRIATRAQLVQDIAELLMRWEDGELWDDRPSEVAEHIVARIVEPCYTQLPGRMQAKPEEAGQ